MLCPQCQTDNPGNNRFCGQCGAPLSAAPQSPANPPRPSAPPNGSNAPAPPRRPFIVSTTAMADVTAQMLNTRVVLPSPKLNATSHSGYSSPLEPVTTMADNAVQEPAPVDPQDEPMFAEYSNVHEFDLDSAELDEAEERMEAAAAEHEAHMPVSETAPVAGSTLGLTAPVASAPEVEEPHVSAAEENSEPAYARNAFLHIDDTADPSSSANDVSGPSFLGLGSSAEYVEEPPRSYGRLIVVVLLFAVVVVLGALEWRASKNGESTNPMDVLHLKLPKKKGQGQVEVVQQQNPPANPSADTSGAPNSVTNNGKPDLVAEPNQPAAKSGPTETDIPAQNGQAASSNAAPSSAAPPSAANSSPAPVSTTSATKPPDQPAATKPAPQPAEVAKSAPPASTKPAAAQPAAANTKPTASTSAEEPPVDASLNGGSFELQKGIAAGDTEMGRMWLWKSLAKGNGEAPVLLADMYANGKGIPKDCEQAMLILNAAARKVNVRARSKLASMYATGTCVPQDRVQAYKWMSSALQANPGNELLTKNRDTLYQQMTPAERQRASR